jgi:hypothetical protein
MHKQLIPSTEQSQRLQGSYQVYEAVEPTLIDCINGHCRSSNTTCNLTLLSILDTHAKLREVRPVENLSPVQAADQHLTREWLQVKVWQACLSHSLLLPDIQAGFEELTMGYPLVKLYTVANLIRVLPLSGILGNGQAMVRPCSSDML